MIEVRLIFCELSTWGAQYKKLLSMWVWMKCYYWKRCSLWSGVSRNIEKQIVNHGASRQCFLFLGGCFYWIKFHSEFSFSCYICMVTHKESLIERKYTNLRWVLTEGRHKDSSTCVVKQNATKTKFNTLQHKVSTKMLLRPFRKKETGTTVPNSCLLSLTCMM